MAGVSVGGGGGKGKRRDLDSDINMIPMIDLLMVTISFLLITAVWVQAQRLEADAQVPGSNTNPPCEGDCKEDAKLHVETSDPTKFTLAWKQGRTVVRSVDVPREEKKKGTIGFPTLASKINEEWKTSGLHHESTDRQFDRAVVHAANDMPYSDLIAVMDAVEQPQRQLSTGSKLLNTAAFNVTFATD